MDSSNRIPGLKCLGPQSTCPPDRGCTLFGTTHPVQLNKYHSGNCSKRWLKQHRTCLTTCLVRKIDKRKGHLRPMCLRMFRWGNSSTIRVKGLRVSSSICQASRACNSRTNRQQPASNSSPSDTTYSCWAGTHPETVNTSPQGTMCSLPRMPRQRAPNTFQHRSPSRWSKIRRRFSQNTCPQHRACMHRATNDRAY